MSQLYSEPTELISALDGRYRSTSAALAPFVSEEALIKYRIRVEARWLLLTSQHPQIYPGTLLTATMDSATAQRIRSLLESWAVGRIPDDAPAKVRAYENTTRHDVKAVEYFIKESLDEAGASPELISFIHFALTSEDVNNLAYGLMILDAREHILMPTLGQVISQLRDMTARLKDQAMISRTHGQTASPTTMGKEMRVFADRLQRQATLLGQQTIYGKCAGAVGNYNAHHIAYPDISWPELAKEFVEQQFKLTWNPMVTQIESHDAYSEFLDTLARISTIGIDLCQDIWGYISLGYFSQKLSPDETGSSTMPHKVNPIDFENAEGNFGLSRTLAQHLSHKLPISRWQRDLSDSTVMRSTGTVFGYFHIAQMHLLRGMSKIRLHAPTLEDDLNNSWEVLAEAIQTVWRKHGGTNAYEHLKDLTRGQSIDEAMIKEIIASPPPGLIFPLTTKGALNSLPH